ncbi:LamG-like jellyroll fold domain-containing protein [Actinoplanes sp. HUAS TT8]|uniref:LamG-like jellyroll fold domain-containing protein n=1 Tax=Actinoplanes sp. HUAS TT8 TaxID=3447453 RepID=UPI003F51E5CE
MGWLDFRWTFGMPAEAFVGIPVQERGPGSDGHYGGRKQGFTAAKPVSRGSWSAPKVPEADAFDPQKSTKLPGRSNTSSDIYQNSDGSQTVKVSTGKMNYQGADGKWRAIDTTLSKGADGRLRTAANSFDVSLAGPAKATRALAVTPQPLTEDLVRVTLPGGQLFAYRLQDALAVTPVVDGELSTYPEIQPSVDVELRTLTSSVKETLVLKSAASAREFVFPLTLQGLTPRLNTSGELELLDNDGAVALLVPRPFMEDSSPVDAMGDRKKSYDVGYELVQVDGKPALKVAVGDTWLDDPARVWPVRVDPTVYTGKTLSGVDAFVDNEAETGPADQDGNNLAVGRWQNNIARSFVNFSSFDTNGFVGKRVTGAKLWVYLTWTCTKDTYRNIYVSKVTKSWTASGVAAGALAAGPTYSGPIGTLKITDHTPASTNTGGDRSVGQWHAVSLDPTTFYEWATKRGSANWDYGLAITADEDVTDSWKRFTSANYSDKYKTWLELTYANNVAPQVNALYPGSGTQSPTLTPQLIADGYDPDGFPATLEYNFEVFEEAADGTQTKIKESGWRPDKTWTVPSGVLKWGKRYRWQATLHDGRLNAGLPSYTWQPAWRNVLTTPVPQPATTSALADNGATGFAPGVGTYTTSATDAQVSSVGPELAISRSYNSADPRTASAFGAGWSSILDAKVTERKDVTGALTTVEVAYPTGQTVAYGRNTDGTFSAGLGRYAKFTAVTGGYQLTDKSGVSYLFTTALTGGYGLTSITDGNGRTLKLTYTSGKVTQLTSTATKRNLNILWSGAHVASVSTDAARTGEPDTVATWTYTYSGDQLTTVCPPTSTTQCTKYGYSDANLYPSTVENLDAYSYWRLGENAGNPQAASATVERMKADYGTHTNVSLGAAGALAGSTATAASYNGTSARTALPAKLVSQSGYQSISMWFKTAAGGDQVLYSQSWDPITSASTNNPYNPTLYIGTNGQLYGTFPTIPTASLGSILGGPSGRCLDSGASTPGTKLQLWDCNGTSPQTWSLSSTGQIKYTLDGVTRCIQESQSEPASKVLIQDCSTAAAQKWRLTGDGRIVSQESGMCLHPDSAGTVNGTVLLVYTCGRPYYGLHTFSWQNHAALNAGGVTVNDGNWHHVVLSAAGDRQSLYLDGVRKATQTGVTVSDIQPRYQYLGAGHLGGGWPSQDNTVAYKNTGTPDYYSGSLSDAAIFDRPLTDDLVAELYAARTSRKLLSQVTRPSGGVAATIEYDPVSGKVRKVTDADNGTWTLNDPEIKGSSQVYASAVLGGSPVDYWRLNDLPGTTEPYNEVNGTAATYSATVLGGTAGTDGPFRDTTAPLFDGAAGTGIDADTPSVNTAGSFTVSAWVNVADVASHHQAVAIVGARSTAFMLGYDSGVKKWAAVMCTADADTASCPRTYANTTVPSASAWTHLAGSFDATTKKLTIYVNGMPEGSSIASFTPWTGTGPLLAGRARWVGTDVDPWKGRVAEIATFATKLSDAQIKAQYDAADRNATGVNAVPMPAKSLSLTDPTGQVSKDVYDLYSGQQIAEVDTLGNLTQYGYDAETGTMKLLVDPNGNKTEYVYDARGNVIEQSTWQDQTNAATKSTTRFTYFPDATTVDPAPDPRNDKLLTVRDARTDGTYVTTYAYDVRGNMTSVTDPLGRVTSTDYTDDRWDAPGGLAVEQVTAGGAVVNTYFDDNGDIEGVADAAGQETWFRYDNLGRVTERRVATGICRPSRCEAGSGVGGTTVFTYDKLGRLLTVTEPEVLNRVTGAVHTPITTYTYNADGQVLTTTVADATGGDAPRTETSTYNALGQLESQTDPSGSKTTFTYNKYGDQATATDAAGTTVETKTDSEGQVLETWFKNFTGDPDKPTAPADLRSESRKYDAGGRLISTTDAENFVTKFEYTNNNLLKTSTRFGASDSFVLENNVYDLAGNMTKQVTNNGRTTTTYTQDQAGRTYKSTIDPTGVNRTVEQVLGDDDEVLATTVKDSAGVTVGYEETIQDPYGRDVVSTTYPTTGTSPVARWKLAETAGDTAADSAGSTVARASSSGARWSTEHPARPGLTGSLEIEYDQNRVLGTDVPVVDTKRSFSVGAWVQLDDLANDHIAMSQGYLDYNGFELGYDAETKTWSIEGCRDRWWDCVTARSNNQATTGAWTHLLSVYDATAKKLTLYVNGQPQNSVPITGIDPEPGWMTIGDGSEGWSPSKRWDGKIADVQAYQKALTNAEITEIYNGTATFADRQVIRESYRRDSGGNVMSSADAEGNITYYEYDESGNLAVTVEPPVTLEEHGRDAVQVNPISYAGYNTFGEQTEDKDPNGNTITTRYDANGRQVETVYPAYTAPGSATALRPTESVVYDKTGQVSKVIGASGEETTYTYDMLGRVTKQTTPDGEASRYTYDNLGRTRSVTDPSGAKQLATYDYLDRPESATELVRQTGASNTTTFEYGPGGWLSKTTSPDNLTSTALYNAVGESTSITDAAHVTTTMQYDGLGRASRTTLADGTYATTSYDLAGRPLVQSSYDAADKLLQKSTTAYDREGNVVAVTDPRNTTMRWTYDASGLMTSQTEPISDNSSIVTRYGYDAAGQPTRFTDGRGNDFWTTYNTWSQVESRIEPATTAHPDLADRTFTTAYDLSGQPVTDIKPGGVRVDYTYDRMGQLVKAAGSGAEGDTRDREFGYDKAGRITSLSGGTGTNTLTWDDRGLLTSVTGPSGNSSFTYTGDGAMKTRVDAAGTTTYGYDAAGRLSSIANPATGVQASLGYDTLSQLSKITYGDNGNARWFGYDSSHRLTSDELKTTAGVSIAKISLGYDNNSNLTSKVTSGFAGSAANTYTYDLANRLQTWNNGTATVDYEYDKSGNRTKAGGKTFTYDARNRLMQSSTGDRYDYTARGTLRHTISGTVARETVTDAFDQVLRQQGDTGTYADYSYDGLGRAIKDGSAYTGLGNDLAADSTSVYTRDPAGDLAAVKQGGTSVYAWTDQHTDVVGEFTATGTALSGSTTYDPLGAVVAQSGHVGNLGFQQEYTEPATGRVNMHARWYNPDTGQFDTRDSADLSPAGQSANANRYGYGNGNPLSGTDPSGHSFLSMNSCSNAFTCMLKGFVNSFDFIDMAKDAINTISDLRGTLNSMISGMISEANAWKSKIGNAIHDRVDCGVWWMPVSEKTCNNAIDSFAAIAGWVCAFSGVCQILDDCVGNGSRLACAENVGSILADGVKALVSAGAGAVYSRVATRINKMLKKYKLPDRRKNHRGGGSSGGLSPQDEKNYVRQHPANNASKYKDNGSGKVTCKSSKCKKKPKDGKNTRSGNKPKNNKPKNNKPTKGGKTPSKAKGSGSKKPTSTNKGSKPSGSKSSDTAGPKDPGRDIPTGAKSNGSGGDRQDYGTCEHSFDPKTRVLMADGSTKPIAAVEVGDQVTATDPESGKTTSQPVTVLHDNLDTEFADVTVTAEPQPAAAGKTTGEGDGDRSTRGPTGTVLHATQNHPFWDATAQRWIDAGSLEPGKSTLIGPNGEIQHVTAVQVFTGAKQMRDLTVDNIHTYYVLAGTEPVLVHNNNCPTPDERAHARASENAAYSTRPGNSTSASGATGGYLWIKGHGTFDLSSDKLHPLIKANMGDIPAEASPSPGTFFGSHVEVQAATLMRILAKQAGPGASKMEARLMVSKPGGPCSFCSLNVAGMLPKDSALVVRYQLRQVFSETDF